MNTYRDDEGLYRQLVNRAIAYLPMPTRMSAAKVTAFAALADPEMARRLLQAISPEALARTRGDAARHPNRLFANALVNVAWRNGLVENLHAGSVQGYPLGERRVTQTRRRS